MSDKVELVWAFSSAYIVPSRRLRSELLIRVLVKTCAVDNVNGVFCIECVKPSETWWSNVIQVIYNSVGEELCVDHVR